MLRTVVVVCIFNVVFSAPYHYFDGVPLRNTIYPYAVGNPRPLPSIGDLISGSSWFPVEINVPDILGSFVNGVSSIPNTISNGISGIVGYVQRLPFVNRIISQNRPRPLLVFVPNASSDDRNDNFGTYSDEVDVLTHYWHWFFDLTNVNVFLFNRKQCEIARSRFFTLVVFLSLVLPSQNIALDITSLHDNFL